MKLGSYYQLCRVLCGVVAVGMAAVACGGDATPSPSDGGRRDGGAACDTIDAGVDADGRLLLTCQCSEDRGRVVRYVSDNVAPRYSAGCVADSDCVLASGGMSCQEGCPVSVRATRSAMYLSERDALSREFCPSLPLACGGAVSCSVVDGGACVSGTCQVVIPGLRP